MGKFIIEGGNVLEGEVRIESAKNAVLPIIASSILCDEEIIIKDCPKISDVLNMLKILEVLGGNFYFNDSDLHLNCKGVNNYILPKELSQKLRSSILFSGALLSKLDKVKISLPGGCKIGSRPIDLHLKCFRELGVLVDENDYGIKCKKVNDKGGVISLPIASVGATENAIILSAISKSETKILNPAREPEIIDLCNFINAMGGNIRGAGSGEIIIKGVKKLHGIEYKPIHDRIEFGTFLIGSLILGKKIDFFNVKNENISILLGKICNNACKMIQENDIIHIEKIGEVKPFIVKTAPYPFFSTDLQPQISVLATSVKGKSIITESLFENRFHHFFELNKMGAKVSINGSRAIVFGGRKLHGKVVDAHDLRCGSALTLAGLYAEGITEILNVEHIDRGYLDFDKKLAKLGAKIKRE